MDRERKRQPHLLDAIKENNLHLTERLLNTGADVNRARNNDVPLCLAAENGLTEILQLLLTNGAELTKSNAAGLHPSHLAARYGHLTCLKLLMSAGLDVNQETTLGDVPLYYATINNKPTVVEYLLESGAGVNERASFLYSRNQAIHAAASLEDPSVLNILLAHHAEVSTPNDDKKLPIHIAADAGHRESVERLIKCGSPIDLLDAEGYTPLLLAACNGHAAVVKTLCVAGASLNQTNNAGQNLLHIAASKGHLQVAQVGVFYGANANAEDGVQKRTALHLAITRCAHKMKEQWGSGRERVAINMEIEMLDTLLQAGANINAQDHMLETPLHLCVKDGCAFVLEYLINSGANCTLLTKQGTSALTLACNENVHQGIRLLIQLSPALVSLPQHHRAAKHSPFCILIQRKNTDCLRVLNEAGYVCSKGELDWCTEVNGKKVPIDIVRWMEREVLQPWSLQKACRTRIRNLLSEKIVQKAHKLPIPQKLIDYVILKRVVGH